MTEHVYAMSRQELDTNAARLQRPTLEATKGWRTLREEACNRLAHLALESLKTYSLKESFRM